MGALFFLTSNLFASFFGQPQLAVIMPVVALTFVFLGFQSTSSALLQKQKTVAPGTIAEVVVAAISLVVHVALALVTPTIWAQNLHEQLERRRVRRSRSGVTA